MTHMPQEVASVCSGASIALASGLADKHEHSSHAFLGKKRAQAQIQRFFFSGMDCDLAALTGCLEWMNDRTSEDLPATDVVRVM